MLSSCAKVKRAIAEQLDTVGCSPERIKSALAGIAFGVDASKIVTDSDTQNRKEQDRTAALRELARVQGMVTEKREVRQVSEVRVVFDETDPAERAAHARAVIEKRKGKE